MIFKKNYYLSNSFALSMLRDDAKLQCEKINPQSFKWEMGEVFRRGHNIVNTIGHADLDNIVRDGLSFIPKGERKNIALEKGDCLFVAQYKGPRLPEGTTKLPEEAKIEFWIVYVS